MGDGRRKGDCPYMKGISRPAKKRLCCKYESRTRSEKGFRRHLVVRLPSCVGDCFTQCTLGRDSLDARYSSVLRSFIPPHGGDRIRVRFMSANSRHLKVTFFRAILPNSLIFKHSKSLF